MPLGDILQNLESLVHEFRSVLEISKPSDFTYTSLAFSQFPGGCCDDASILLGLYLKEHGFENIILIHGVNGGDEEELSSHDWLQVGSMVVDITASQFDWRGYDCEEIIIAKSSSFHDKFEQPVDNQVAPWLSERYLNLVAEFQHTYELITSKLKA